LVERWNGKTWSIVKAPDVGMLTSVSCTSATFCFAVGGSLPERWNGTAWSTVKLPKVAGATAGSGLGSVSCTSATYCVGVGTFSVDGLSYNTFVERWNGKTWSIVPSPLAGGSDRVLDGVSCPTATTCLAVGLDEVEPAEFNTLAEHWNGNTWSEVAVPLPAGSSGGVLNGVSCPSATNCLAVGWAGRGEFPGDAAFALAEQWNGSTWSVVKVPDVGRLSSVSCTSAMFCFAVGGSLPERWNGTTWSVVPSPNVG